MRGGGGKALAVASLAFLLACATVDAAQQRAAPASPAQADCDTRSAAADWRAEVCGLVRAGRGAAAVLLLQRRLAVYPADAAARTLLEALLAELGAGPAAREVPGNAGLIGRPWWQRSLAMAQSAAWLAAEAGHDSNINSATGLSIIDLPLLNYRSLVLSPLLVRQGSAFLGLAGGVAAARPLAPALSVHAAVQASARYNAEEAAYLPQSYQARLGARGGFGRLTLEAAAGFEQRRVGKYRLVDRSEAGLTLRLDVSPEVRLGLAATGASQAYPLFNGLRTRSQITAVTARHLPSGLGLAAMALRERSLDGPRDLDRDASGVTLEWNRTVRGAGNLQVQWTATRSVYLEPSVLFATQRLDKSTLLSIAYAHRLAGAWTLTPRLVLEENASTIPLLAFRRRQVMVELRRDW